MMPKEVSQRLNEGEDPLELSIEKWRDISKDKPEALDLGASNCGLCQKYRSDQKRCLHCPVCRKTGKTKCDGTPIDRWYEHQKTHISILFKVIQHCPVCIEIAKEELAFLMSLRNKQINTQKENSNNGAGVATPDPGEAPPSAGKSEIARRKS